MIRLQDCEIEREPGWNRIRHLPTGRCVACQDDNVNDSELFSALCQDLDFLEENELMENSKIVARMFEDQTQ